MKGLERFFIIGWMAEEEFIRDNSDKKKQVSCIPNPCSPEENRGVPKKEKVSDFKLIKGKRHHLRPIKIYCREKTQLAQKLFFNYNHSRVN